MISSKSVLDFCDALEDVTKAFEKLDSKEFKTFGSSIVVDQGASDIAGYTDLDVSSSLKYLPAIVFGDHTRRFKYITEPFALGADGARVFVPKIAADRRYLFHFLSSLHIESAGYSRHFKFLKRKRVFLPTLEEQRRIAAILDKADEIRKKRGMAIQKLDLLAESVFIEMFGGSTNIKLQHLGDVVELQRGSSPRPISDWITSDPNGVNWIKIGDATASDKYITTCKEKIKPEGVKHSRLVREGDFLLSNSMSFGRPYILKTSGCIHDGWLLIRDVDGIFHQDYLYALLSSSGVAAQFAKLASGAVVKNLNIDAVAKVQVLVPDLKDQKDFSRKIQSVESCKLKQLAALHSTQTLQRSLLSVLFEK